MLTTLKGHADTAEGMAPESHDATLIWNTDGVLLRTLTHDDFVAVVAFSPDGRWLATSTRNTTRTWEASSGEEVHTLTHDELGVRAVAFSPHGRWLAAATFGNGVVVWALTTPSRQ